MRYWLKMKICKVVQQWMKRGLKSGYQKSHERYNPLYDI